MDTHASHWDRLGAWIYDPFLWLGERRGMARRRHDRLAQAEGRVLEIGAGTGLNLRHYGESVEELVLTEPVEPMARALERRVKRLGRPADVRRASAEALPFADDSFDMVVAGSARAPVGRLRLRLPLQPAHARAAREQPADDREVGVRELARHAAAGSASDDRGGGRVSAARRMMLWRGRVRRGIGAWDRGGRRG